jgi:hypothetical protein
MLQSEEYRRSRWVTHACTTLLQDVVHACHWKALSHVPHDTQQICGLMVGRDSQ